jgi:hypothetical protein
VGIAVGILSLFCIEAKVLRFLAYFRIMAAILVPAWDTMIIFMSLKSSWVALPFVENRMKKIQPVPKIEGEGASEVPLLSTNVTNVDCPVKG